MLLEDYNYFINKAVQQYINLTYAKIELDQQSTDDIRVLRTSVVLPAFSFKDEDSDIPDAFKTGLFQTSYYVDLPRDYMHLLNCNVEFQVQPDNYKCNKKGDCVYFKARRLTPQLYSQILDNEYMKPTYKRPYYYINNYNESSGFYSPETGLNPTTNPQMDDDLLNYNNGRKNKELAGVAGDNKLAKSNLVDAKNSIGDRLANASNVRLELRFGDDDRIFKPTKVYIDYIKAPMFLKLTNDQIYSTIDYSQILEFPDYVCFEILNIFVRLLMENFGDPRLQTNIPLNNTITNPLTQ